MNNLVAYDADSDDESPRRQSSETATWAKEEKSESSSKQSSERKRHDSEMYEDDQFSPASNGSDNGDSNFAEPPPPKRNTEHSQSPPALRTPQATMPHTSSQASLVSYSGDGDDDEMNEEYSKGASIDETPKEPEPPARQSQDSDSEEEDRLIDLAIEKGKNELNKIGEGSSPAFSNTNTPARNDNDSPNSGDTPRGDVELDIDDDGEIRIPPPPADVQVDERLQAKFELAFRQKANGINLNHQMQSRQDFSNPMSYERFIELFDIDEKGTNFPKTIFDPHCFPENCYYDAIGEEQKKLVNEQQQKSNLKKAPK